MYFVILQADCAHIATIMSILQKNQISTDMKKLHQLMRTFAIGLSALLTCNSMMTIGNYTKFTAKTAEGIDMTFFVEKTEEGVCFMLMRATLALT